MANKSFEKDFAFIEKKYRSLSKTYKKEKTLFNLQYCEKESMALLKLIRATLKGKVRGSTATFLQEYKEKVEEFLYNCRYDYLELLNINYCCDIDIDEYIKKNKKKLEHLQIVTIIAESGMINNVFQNIIKELIPAHPKDEYKETRGMKRHFIIHCGGTNTGKTYNAIQALKRASSGVYLAPLRLLALEIFQTLNAANVPCTLSTGEEDIITPNARHISSTIEKLNTDKEYDVAVIDEAQMMSDIQRGNAWTRAILAVKANEVHVCCSKNANNLLIKLITDCGDTYEVHEYQRNTPLNMESAQFKFPEGVESGDALVVFSKKMVLRVAGILSSGGRKVSVLYGNLPPETRRKQMEMFINKQTDVVVTTDVIGMGLNLPIKRVVFMETSKYDGGHKVINWELNSAENIEDNSYHGGRRKLTASEIKQIAGRAGRKNIFDEGLVNSLRDKSLIKVSLDCELEDLTQAYTTPADKYILSFPIGTLRERLVAWLQSDDTIDYIKKANIDEPLTLLNILDEWKPDLSIDDKYKLIFIPFDSKKDELVQLWKLFIEEYIDDREISFPKQPIVKNLDTLEMYYRQLDLYYAFCKEMHKTCDAEYTMQIKSETSAEIHEILRSQMKNMKSACKCCGAEIPWDFPFNVCQDCYSGRRSFNEGYYGSSKKHKKIRYKK